MASDPPPLMPADFPSCEAPKAKPSVPFLHHEVPPPRVPVALRLIIYVLLVGLSMFFLSALPTQLGGASLAGSRFPWLMFLQEGLLFLGAYLPACLMALLEHRSVHSYGLPWRKLLSVRFGLGCVTGLAEIFLLIAALTLFGVYRFGNLALPGPLSMLEWFLFWLLFFVVVGLSEEFIFRGYLQFTLSGAIGYWPAACILSLGFGAVHLLNRGENWAGAADVAVVGLVFALALERTGNLWFVVGWHAAFDFGETFLFSVPNSGILLNGHLSNATLEGPAWLTGGTVGPEGSIFSFLIMGLAALLIHVLFPQRVYPVPAK